LLKLYALNLTERQLQEIKRLIGDYFAAQATQAMDDFWKKNALTTQDMERWANDHDRVKAR
jgi:hypothetical protein